MEKIKSINNLDNIWDVIKNITSLVFDEKIWFWQEMRKIAEVTYSYTEKNPETEETLNINNKEINLNTTLFISLWELDLDNFSNSNEEEKIKLIKKSSNIITKKIKTKIDEINKSIQEIKKIFKNTKIKKQEKLKLEILFDSLKEKKDLLQYCLNWFVYEEEKAWIEINITVEERKKIDLKQKKLDKKLFWWEIKENSQEVDLCLDYIIEKLENNKINWKSRENTLGWSLNDDEYNRFLWYIEKAKKYSSKWYKYQKKQRPVNNIEELEKYTLSQKDYILWFNLFIEAFWKMDFNVETNPFVKSISDWPRWFQIPTTEEFSKFTIPRFLRLNWHENETHNISEYNSQKIIWSIRWKDSTTKDEWVAILMENMLEYWEQIFKKDEKTWKTIFDLEKLQFNSNFVKVFFWEILDNEELLDFLELSNKIEPDILSPIDRYFRLKRSNCNWVQHKDTTYTRWLFIAASEVNKYILSDWKKWIDFYSLFNAKAWFQDIEKVNEIKEEENIETIKPMFLSDIIYFAIKSRLSWDFEINTNNLIKYLSHKYPILDFTEDMIKNISKETLKSISWIISLTLKNIFDQETNEAIIEVRSRVDNLIFDWRINKAIKILKPLRQNALIKD